MSAIDNYRLSRSPISPSRSHNDDDFTIPELPSGTHLLFVLISPWDDPFYMGLHAIEIFTDQGIRPEIEKIETDARECYGDLNSLLCMNVCPSTDPRAMWMCKYRSVANSSFQDAIGRNGNVLDEYGSSSVQLPITIKITLKRRETIALIRIWNYSESRVYALRGVCRMQINLDERCIFHGEISCAFSGETVRDSGKPFGDTILFSTNEEILTRIAENDSFLSVNDEEESEAVLSEGNTKLVTEMDEKNCGPSSPDVIGETSDGLDSLKLAPHTTASSDTPTAEPAATIASPTGATKFLSKKGLHYNTAVGSAEPIPSVSFDIDSLAEIQRPSTGGLPMALSSPALTSVSNAAAGESAFDGGEGGDFRPPSAHHDHIFATRSLGELSAAGVSSSTTVTATTSTTYHSSLEGGDDPALLDTSKLILADECSGEEYGAVDVDLNDDQLVPSDQDFGEIYGKVFHMELLANWGAPDTIGLTGIQFLGANSEPICAECCVIRYSGDQTSTSSLLNASLLRLINGKNLTCSADQMWLTRWDCNEAPPTISFNFAKDVCIAGVSIWNYNASAEMSYSGVKCAQFYVNGRPICSPVLLRRAPGCVYFDYVQDVMFDRCHLFRPITSRPMTQSISAFIFQLRLLSSWGDEYYIGLNGIELYNRNNQLMKLKPQNLAAFPESVNILPSISRDLRSSDKLIDGVNDTKKPQHMWLTPVLPNSYARIFFIFDAPTFVSRIRIFNYRKTPERGVHHIAITADDLIIFSGEVPQSDANSTGILDVSLRDLY